MYAIINKINKKYLYGTDFRSNTPRQRLTDDKALLFSYLFEAETEFKRRECNNKTYKIVEVELKIKEVNNGRQN